MSSVTSHGRRHYLFLLLSLLMLGTRAVVNAADTFDSGRNITDGETLVSAGGSFTMGFFSLGVPARRYLGIWFSVSEDAVCWVANRDRPINGTSGLLMLGDAGRLLLLDAGSGGQVIWSSNSTGSTTNSSTAQLLDSGNLVIRDGATSADSQLPMILWQSFDHPSNTLLPGMKTGKNRWTGAEWHITSWRSPTDPSPGPYRRGTETKKGSLPENAIWNGRAKTYRTGPWNGVYFNGVPEMASYADMFVYEVTVSPGEVSYGYAAKPGAPLSRIVVTDAGTVQRLVWDASSGAWKTFYSAPRDTCDAYARCGAFGLCDTGAASTSMCGCVRGFVPASPSAWYMRETSAGCRRSVALDCAGATDGLAVLRGVKLPDTYNASVDVSVGMEECRERCLVNCSCVAYAAADVRGGGCIIWSDTIVDIRYVDRGQDLYLRLAKSELAEDASRKMSAAIIATICVACAAAGVFLSLAFVIWRNRIRRIVSRDARRVAHKNDAAVHVEEGKPDPDDAATAVTAGSIDLATLEKATRNFSTRNVIGEGAFGVVYEGQLLQDHPLVAGLPGNGRKVAVKRLKVSSSLPSRVLSDYTREVETVCNLRHDNLVRLLAHCSDGNERVLVYEYVHNKSLNLYIFGKGSARASLNWARRLEIIRGIARGVWYLHEGLGEENVLVHRDLKPSNVLLDRHWRPKIAGFGTAKLFRDDLTGTQTVVVSPGYASPEYAKDGDMTPKCDVFSFGVVLLETVSGRRNSASPSVVSQAWKLWEERRVMDLLDPAVCRRPRGSGSSEIWSSELRRCIQVGLLCVQEAPGDRPAMSAVVGMLGSKDSRLEQPKCPALLQLGPTCYGGNGMSLDWEPSTVVNLT
ncbi:receptor-like serine/threonine-protein kinase SD1-8 [Brachypodium distachyon]|uniref:Receptor-like serine/threonine-protein kinase n=1 Tax=Brachypodium distachyon TaxID=15368 RepID=A0A2K2CIT3_BRADI|nr:receptor-like serine/threonine-protein kinase SD1-8 [Brachypodium distachyon]PNT61936.1 hypothetical protein BRADI_5g23100v3 [Brachypodium distachyon]|eukprot:XP_024311527.1 receptor-like serine/threonine-protein kinase SD1-8 [Brachypodium distachyon]